ncbi:hypothetical protein GQ44DRAFT_765995 [Phaeosphaeriaceae sp. PMI808]|nr:hypothetical protein GQ44DRAFT_765995 [Phaeosphaeriaceae sp. PMI808]
MMVLNLLALMMFIAIIYATTMLSEIHSMILQAVGNYNALLQTALEKSREAHSELGSKLVDVNLQLAAANMKTQQVLAITLSREREIKKQSKYAQFLKTQIQELKNALNEIVDEKQESLAQVGILKANNTKLKESIRSMNADGYDLAMQIRYKADELHEMTVQMDVRDNELTMLRAHVNSLMQADRADPIDGMTGDEDEEADVLTPTSSNEEFIGLDKN